MVPSKVASEAVIRNAITVIASTLTPCLMLVTPRTGARLNEATAHLSLVLRHAAMVNTAVGGAVVLHAAVISAAISLLRPGLLLRRFGILLLMLLLRLLSLIAIILLLVMLGEGSRRDRKNQQKNCSANNTMSFH